MRKLMLLLVSLVLLGSAAMAQDVEEATESVPAKGAKSLDVMIDFAAGQLMLSPADMEDAAKAEIYYTPRYVSYDISYDVRGDVGYLVLESEHRKRHWDDAENEWDVMLNNRLPMRLEIDAGACEAEIDLGGIPLTDLSLSIGATSGSIDFSKPNPERMRLLEIDAGASSLDVEGLANANFDELEFSGGAASCELDFRGDLRGDCVADVDIGMGSLDIMLSRGTPIRLEGDDDGLFSSVDFNNLDIRKVHDGVWESDDFKGAKNRLTIHFDVGMGSIDFRSR